MSINNVQLNRKELSTDFNIANTFSYSSLKGYY